MSLLINYRNNKVSSFSISEDECRELIQSIVILKDVARTLRNAEGMCQDEWDKIWRASENNVLNRILGK